MLTRKRKAWADKRDGAVFKGLPLQPPAPVAVRYANGLQKLVAQMTTQTARDLKGLFETDAASKHFGQDATIASQSRILINALRAKFDALFTQAAKPLAETMVTGSEKASSTALHGSLTKLSGGLSLKTTTMSAGLRNIYAASVAENVSLIKSISEQYIKQVEGAVMRSITTGNGLQDLVPALEKYSGQTERRAKNCLQRIWRTEVFVLILSP